MSIPLLITLVIIALGIYLFVRESFSIDTTSILIMALFIVTGVLAPDEGFAGFNHPATLTLGCMFVISSAVFKTGVLDRLSMLLVEAGKWHRLLALTITVLMAATLSAFINDTAVVALLMPIVLEVARKTGTSPSKMLIPLSFASLFGGTCTLIGTSTNILVTSYSAKLGVAPFSMFEFTAPALILLGVGLLYILTVGQWLLPNRKAPASKDDLLTISEEYFTTIHIMAGHAYINQPLQDWPLFKNKQIRIKELERNSRRMGWIEEKETLQENDVLRVLLAPAGMESLMQEEGIWIESYKINGTFEEEAKKSLYEVMVPAGSLMAGQTLADLNFRNKYGASVMAVRHRDEVAWNRITALPFREGDLLLLLCSEETMQQFAQQGYLFPLNKHQSKRKLQPAKAIWALVIAAGVITAASLGIADILMAGMVGCLLMLTTGVIKPQEAYAAIEWKVIFMVAGVLSMGAALEKTGGAEKIAVFVGSTLSDLSPMYILSAVYLLCLLCTNILSSKATAALMTPIVLSVAQALQVSERPFLVAVMFACSLTFMTPVSYPTNTMVYAPGQYRFTDYVRVGGPLNVLIWLLASWLIPQFFPFS